jgi:hypothetical protein
MGEMVSREILNNLKNTISHRKDAKDAKKKTQEFSTKTFALFAPLR